MLSPLPPLFPHHKYDPRFPAITFYSDPILKMVDSDGCQLEWPEIGMSLCIPPNVIPDGKVFCLEVWPCLCGPFVPPEGHEFSSPMYLISPAFQFENDVQLSINHFEELKCGEDAASMTFVTSPYTPEIHQSKLRYGFKLLGRGEFKMKSATGVIHLKHFCVIGVARKSQGSSQGYNMPTHRK